MKSPNRQGRFGPDGWQDWRRACQRAVAIQRETGSLQSGLVIASGFKGPGSFSELAYQQGALEELGGHMITIIPEGLETIGQLEAVLIEARWQHARLIIVSSWVHFPRVWMLTRGENVSHRVVVGIPRPKEFLTDVAIDAVILGLYPFIGVAGVRRFLIALADKLVIGRRQEGVL